MLIGFADRYIPAAYVRLLKYFWFCVTIIPNVNPLQGEFLKQDLVLVKIL